jgi:hypothetical protein
MNATSSRAHTITTLTFTQKFFDREKGTPLNEKNSEIYFYSFKWSSLGS